jgi:glycosyltransferase involved in cell wall biosynthesis
MIEAKGIRDFVEAAAMVNSTGRVARFILAGEPDQAIPGSIPEEDLLEWSRSGVVEWLGHRDDIASVINGSDIICLPSHGGEGVPKFLLEGLAAAKPIVTTDVPGCRDLVDPGVNGLVVLPNAPCELAAALKALIDDPNRRARMSVAAARRLARSHRLDFVVDEHVRLYQKLQSARSIGRSSGFGWVPLANLRTRLRTLLWPVA